jgi:hypothetical protein
MIKIKNLKVDVYCMYLWISLLTCRFTHFIASLLQAKQKPITFPITAHATSIPHLIPWKTINQVTSESISNLSGANPRSCFRKKCRPTHHENSTLFFHTGVKILVYPVPVNQTTMQQPLNLKQGKFIGRRFCGKELGKGWLHIN